MKARLCCILLLVSSAAVSAKPPATPAPPAFGETVEVDLVTVEVRATDRSGQPVLGLDARDFQLLEDGKPIEITHFAAVAPSSREAAAPPAPAEAEGTPRTAGPTHLLVYVDDQHLQPAHRARALRQISDFARAHLLSGDRVSVVTDDLGLKLRLPFSTDREALERALAEIEKTPAAGVSVEVARRSAFEDMIAEQENQAKRGGVCGNSVAQPVRDYAQAVRADALRTLGRLRFVVNSLAGVAGRKALLLVTDGIPLTRAKSCSRPSWGSAAAPPRGKG